MIVDRLENLFSYQSINKGILTAITFLSRPDLKELAPGNYAIDGDRVYAIVAKGPGRSKNNCQLETHEKYIDIQLVLEGLDEMGWKPLISCEKPCKPNL